MVKFILQGLRGLRISAEQAGQPTPTEPPAPKPTPAEPADESPTPETNATAPAAESGEEAPRPRRRRRRRSRGGRSLAPASEGEQPTAPLETPPPPAAEGDAPAEDGETPRRRRRPRRRKRGPGGSERSESSDRSGRSDEEQSPDESSVAPEVEPAEPWDPATFAVEPMEGKTRFQDLDIPETIMHGIADLGFQYCTPIQAEILPAALNGQDAMGKAQTGTGKSAAFLIAIFNQLLRKSPEKSLRKGTPRALIIAPTRELAMQIDKDARDIGKYSGLTAVAVFGGMDYQRQQRLLTEQVVDIVIATPGRLLDFKRRQDVHLGHVEIMVIDEADRMLDMGFIPDVRNIIHSTPTKNHRQTMLFSATLTSDVIRLASQWTRDAISIEIEPEQVAVDTVRQIVYITTTQEKFPLLLNIIQKEKPERMMVFANRRDQTRKLTDLIDRYDIRTAMLSGDVPQTKRVRTLEQFREGKIQVLVATDVAGRGIHVENVSHVVNFTLPQDAEDYVHRIGRTGRAGKSGTSISFACESDSFQIPAIEEYIGRELKCEHPDDDMLIVPPKPPLSERHRKAAAERMERADAARGRSGRGGRERRGGGGGGRGRSPSRSSRSHG